MGVDGERKDRYDRNIKGLHTAGVQRGSRASSNATRDYNASHSHNVVHNPDPNRDPNPDPKPHLTTEIMSFLVWELSQWPT